MCAFSVLGARYPAFGANPVRVSGIRCQVPAFEKPAHGVCTMQDRKGLDPGYPVPGTWYLTPMLHSPISNLNKVAIVL